MVRKHFILLLACLAIFFKALSQAPPIVFTENNNQWDSHIYYRAELYGGLLYVENKSLTYMFSESTNHHSKIPEITLDEEDLNASLEDLRKGIFRPVKIQSIDSSHSDVIRNHAYKVQFIGANKKSTLVPSKKTAGVTHYYLGNDKSRWASNVASYDAICYENIYKGIDLKLYNSNGSIKYDFIVAPQANPHKIKLHYSGISKMEIKSGDLYIYTSVNTVVEKKPYAYQIIAQDTIEIACQYSLHNFELSYDIGEYDKNYTLYIDPELIFSTYTGSFADNWGFTATYDGEGNVYSGGIVESTGYPVNIGAFQTTYGGGSWDIALIKYNPTGTERIYAAYLGGSSSEMPHSLIANSKNELLMLGTTGSYDYPTKNAYNSQFMGGKAILYDHAIDFSQGVDMCITRISADGSQILSSTFIGGTANDGINFDWETNDMYGHDSLYYNYGDGARGEIIVDEQDFVYVASTTFSADFPVLQATQASFGGMQDGVVFKLSPDLSSLQWSTYIGGSSKDAAYSLDIDVNNNLFVAGGTCSPTLGVPVNGFMDTHKGGVVDAFIVKMNAANGNISDATYFGSENYDQAYFVKTNTEEHVFIFGQTNAPGSTLIYNAEYNKPNSGQFLASFTNDLQNLRWSTVFGTGRGLPDIVPTAFEVDDCNRIYLAGFGREWVSFYGTNMWYYDAYHKIYRHDTYGWLNIQGTKGLDVTPDAHQSYTDGQDFYFMVIDDEAKELEYATFFGEINYGGYVSHDGGYTYEYIPCPASGRDHVDGGTSRFDKKGNIYQSACSSCGGCNKFPTYPNPGAWSNFNNALNCNNTVTRFRIDMGFLRADFNLPEITCSSLELEFENTSTAAYKNSNVQYEWDFGDGSPHSFDKHATHEYAEKGEYIVTLIAKDDIACNNIDTIQKTLIITDQFSEHTLADIHICKGESAIIGLDNLPQPDFVYEWLPTDYMEGANLPQATVTPPESIEYTLRVTQKWCTNFYTQNIIVYDDDYEITEIIASPSDKVCIGDTIRLTATTNAPTERYLWFDNKNLTDVINDDFKKNYIDIVPQETKTYYVIATGSFCNYSDLAGITITATDNKIQALGDTIICKGDIAEIWVKNLLPEQTLSYEWIPKHSIKHGDTDNRAIVQPDRSMDFIVYASNDSGCTVKDTVHIGVHNFELEILTLRNIQCYGEQNGEIEIAPKGQPPYTLIWNDDSQDLHKQNLAEGTYTVHATDGLGCTFFHTFRIEEPPLLQIIDSSYNHASCYSACNGVAKVQVIGGTKPYSYLWSNGDTYSAAKFLCRGAYSVAVTDARGCKVNYPHTFTISHLDKYPELDAFAEQPIVYKGQSTYLHALANPSDTVQYVWYPSLWLEEWKKPIVKVTPEQSYTYYVEASDAYGCTSTDTVHIQLQEWMCNESHIYIPTAFTPNNDGLNDTYKIESGVITDLHLAIHDRWGEKVYETTDLNHSWDGTFKGKTLHPQVLVYYLEATCLNQEVFTSKGNITIIK